MKANGLPESTPSSSGERFAMQLGYAAMLLARTSRRSFSIGSLESWVAPAIVLRQIQFCFDEHGEPVAYATWAYLTDAMSGRMERDEVGLLHLSDWNAGLNLWVIDVVAPYGLDRPLVTRLLRSCVEGIVRPMRWMRRREDGSVRSVSSRRPGPAGRCPLDAPASY